MIGTHNNPRNAITISKASSIANGTTTKIRLTSGTREKHTTKIESSAAYRTGTVRNILSGGTTIRTTNIVTTIGKAERDSHVQPSEARVTIQIFWIAGSEIRRVSTSYGSSAMRSSRLE